MTVQEFENRFNERYKGIYQLAYFIWYFGNEERRIEMCIFKLDEKHKAFKLICYKDENSFIEEKDFNMVCNKFISLFEDSDKECI